MTADQLTALLDDYLRANFGRRYQPGQHDCVLFIAGWADLVSGSSHADALRGSYETHFGGLKKHVGKASTISLAVEKHLLAAGWQRVDVGAVVTARPQTPCLPPSTLNPQLSTTFQTGDIILTDGDHPGIWRGKSIVASAFGFAGHAYLHRRHATAALRWPHRGPHSPSAAAQPGAFPPITDH